MCKDVRICVTVKKHPYTLTIKRYTSNMGKERNSGAEKNGEREKKLVSKTVQRERER